MRMMEDFHWWIKERIARFSPPFILGYLGRMRGCEEVDEEFYFVSVLTIARCRTEWG